MTRQREALLWGDKRGKALGDILKDGDRGSGTSSHTVRYAEAVAA